MSAEVDPLSEYIEELAAEDRGVKEEDSSVGFDTNGHNHAVNASGVSHTNTNTNNNS